LVEHGTGVKKGFGPERKVAVRENVVLIGETEGKVEYHMTGLRWIAMTEIL
jgi:hypothetical protein